MLWDAVHHTFLIFLVLFFTYRIGLKIYVSIPTSKHDVSVSLPVNVSIDDVIRGVSGWNRDPEPVKYFPMSCRPLTDLVFVKCVQCSPQAMDMVFRRYGYLNNLSMVLPIEENNNLGYTNTSRVDDFRPFSHVYNMMIEHAIYNNTALRRIMRPDVIFFTMIRQPLDLTVSILRDLNTSEVANLTLMDGVRPMQMYLKSIHKHESVFKSHAGGRNPGDLPLTRNLLSHCLGMSLGFPDARPDSFGDLRAVKQYISKLDSEFLLVMIMEYLDESLVLLKRLMCWSFKDILHLGGGESNNKANVSVSAVLRYDRTLHRRWSSADYHLYDHFNRTFWNKVERHGDDFSQDLAYYRYLQNQVRWFCRKVTPYGDSYIQFPETVLSPAFTVTSEDCRLMEAPLQDMLKERYMQQEAQHAR